MHNPSVAGMLPKRDWLEMTSEDFSQGNPSRWIAVLPIAAVEQHGPHLSLGTDAFVAETYLARVRERTPPELAATFLPLQKIGTSEEHRAFPGTLTLSIETWLRTLREIGTSVHRAGVRKLVIVNSHGGNTEVMGLVARDLRVRLGMLVVTASWHRLGYPDGLFTRDEHMHGIHGGDIETSIMLAAYPQLVRRDKLADFRPVTFAMERDFARLRADYPAGFGWMTQDLHASGAVGNAAAATAAKGEAALMHGARAFIALLDDVARFDLGSLAPGPLN
jgi:creatinine amidohydrolase